MFLGRNTIFVPIFFPYSHFGPYFLFLPFFVSILKNTLVHTVISVMEISYVVNGMHCWQKSAYMAIKIIIKNFN